MDVEVPLAAREPQRLRELRGAGTLHRVGMERARDRRDEGLRQVGTRPLKRRCSRLDLLRGGEKRRRPERMPARECLPEHHPDRPDVAGGDAASPRSRSGEMYASVPGTSPTAVSVSASAKRARPKSSRRIEVSGPSSSRTLAGLTSRWTIPSRARGPDLRGSARLPRPRRRRQLSVPRCLAHGRAGDVLVRDVDVAAVARLRVDPLAARMAELRGRACLALGARTGLPLARDDLERDVEAAAFVACEPDRAGASAPEWPDRPVATEDRARWRRGRRSLAASAPPVWTCTFNVLYGPDEGLQ